MPGFTPLYGLEYPVSGDSLQDAVSTIPQHLAADVESVLAGAVGIPAPGAWTALPLNGGVGGWTNFGPPFQVAQFRKVGSLIYTRGLIKPIGASGTGTVATYPVGARPLAQLIFRCGYGGGAEADGRVDVLATGVITAAPGVVSGATSYLNLSDIPPFYID